MRTLTNEDLLIAEAAARSYPAQAGYSWAANKSIGHSANASQQLAAGTLSFDEC